MNTSLKIAAFLMICAMFVSPGFAQKAEEVTITEPGRMKLADLFNAADVVAIVKIVSGDTENYDVAVYKSTVIRGFKGTVAGQTLYFGPYIGLKLGGEYVLFLRNASAPVSPKTGTDAMYGVVHVGKVFNEGYSAMASSYGCVFDGKDVAQQCDYGVRVCTDYIVLPSNIRTFPPENTDTPFGCRWVRKAAFESLVQRIAGKH